jgi:septum formation protein
LLGQIGVSCKLLQVMVDEAPQPGESAAAYVTRLALAKAWAGREASRGLARMPVLAADTAVTVDREILGKPRNRQQALAMMRRLSGRDHRVLTGVALLDDGPATRLSTSKVSFRPVSDDEAIAYWKTGEPVDKAGGYAIQGLAAAFISRLEGSYSGVMGLPLFETAELLGQAGIKLAIDPGGITKAR